MRIHNYANDIENKIYDSFLEHFESVSIVPHNRWFLSIENNKGNERETLKAIREKYSKIREETLFLIFAFGKELDNEFLKIEHTFRNCEFAPKPALNRDEVYCFIGFVKEL